jgi:hypothetical protein
MTDCKQWTLIKSSAVNQKQSQSAEEHYFSLHITVVF